MPDTTPLPGSTEPGNLLRRYLAGEHEAVWADMMALGARVREAPYLDDASAVARETMRRARQNVELIVRRLDQIGYTFWNGNQGRPDQPLRMALGGQVLGASSFAAKVQGALMRDLSQMPGGMRRHVEDARARLVAVSDLTRSLQQPPPRGAPQPAPETKSNHLEDPVVFSAPDAEDLAMVRELETKGMVLPLSLRAWMEEVGDINLAGAHPALCFWEDEHFPGVYADPLMVSFDAFAFERDGWLEAYEADEDPGTMEPVLGWDPKAKARLAVVREQLDYGYSVELPDAGADVLLHGERHHTTFVSYLRIAFRWGGFSGWELHEKRPEAELAFLTSGLLPI
jgi:hypothetical protein